MNAPAAQWDILKQDLRYTARTLNRARGFALTAILVTALGVGANTAAFSVADFVLLRPLPFPDPDALVRLCEGPRTGGGWGCMNQLSPANYRDFKAHELVVRGHGRVRRRRREPGRRRGAAAARDRAVTPEVLPLLGVSPSLGRVFGPGSHDDASAAVISYGLWQSQFGGDPGVLGQTSTSTARPTRSSASCRRRSTFPTRDVQLWTPLTFREEDFADRTNTYIEAVGRLKPGVTFEQARAELAIARRSSRARLPGDERGDRRELLPDARQHVAALPADAADA